MSRVRTVYASAYQRDRIHESRLLANERLTMTVDFNGAIRAEDEIARVDWRTNQPYASVMSDAEIDGRAVKVTLQAQYSGRTLIRCEATLASGDKLSQLIRIVVAPQPYQEGDTWNKGPNHLWAVSA